MEWKQLESPTLSHIEDNMYNSENYGEFLYQMEQHPAELSLAQHNDESFQQIGEQQNEQVIESVQEITTTKHNDDAMRLLRSETRQTIAAQQSAETTVNSNSERKLQVDKFIEVMKKKIEIASSAYEETQLTAHSEEFQINQLQSQILSTGKILGTLKEFSQDLENRRKYLKIKEAQDKLFDIKTKTQKISADIKTVENSIANNSTSNANEDSDYEEILAKNIAIKKSCKEMEEKLQLLRKQYDAKCTGYEGLRENLNKTKEKNRKLLSDLASADTAVNELKTLKSQQEVIKNKQILQLESEKQLRTQRLTEIKQKNGELERSIQEQSFETEQSSVKLLEEEEINLTTKLEEINKIFETKNNENISNLNYLNELKQQLLQNLEDVNTKITASADPLEDLSQHIQELNRKLLNLNETRCNFKIKVMELSNIINEEKMSQDKLKNDLKSNYKQLENTKLIYEQQIKSAEINDKHLNSQMENSVKYLSQEKTKYDNFVSEHKSKLNDIFKRTEYLEACNKYLIDKNNDILKETSSANKELELLCLENESLQSLNNEKIKNAEYLQKDIMKLRESKKQAKRNIECTKEEKPALEGILKPLGKPTTPTKKVSFGGIPSYESSESSLMPLTTSNTKEKTFDELLQAMGF